MLEPNGWDTVSGLLSVEDFYVPANRKVFGAMFELAIRNQPIDIVTVGNFLMERSELDSIGGAPYLSDIVQSTPATTNLERWAQIVREKAIMRQLIRVANEMIDAAHEEGYESTERFLDEVEGKIYKIANETKAQTMLSAVELVQTSIDRLTKLAETRSDLTGLPSGFKHLDKLTSGFQPGDMVVVAARPSMGKTAFALNLAQHAALRAGKSVAFFSLEMGAEQLMMRMLASEARINLSDLKIGKVDANIWPRLIDKAAQMSNANLYIDDTAAISPLEIRSKVRRLKAQKGLDLIMIDYLQMMSLKQKVDNRQHEVSEISKMLKGIAKEFKVPVIALAQLNRAVEGRADRRPMLSDLRESGSIEQDADIIMMLYREDYYDRDNPDIKGLSEVIVGKHRNGPVDTIRLRFEGQYSRFSNLEEAAPEHPLPAPKPVPLRRGPPREGPSPGGP